MATGLHHTMSGLLQESGVRFFESFWHLANADHAVPK